MTEPNNDGLQRCIICGRLYIRRPERVCSMDCKRKAEEKNIPGGSLMESVEMVSREIEQIKKIIRLRFRWRGTK